MTFRAKPVVKRSHRPSWESQDRRNFYLNLGFGLVVVAAILILVIAAGLSWYNEHLASVGSVDGQGISKDEFADRYAIETWRLEEAERQIRSLNVAGRLTDSQAQLQQSVIEQQRNQLPALTLERLIDTKLQAKLAAAEAVAATPADIDAQLVKEATTKESRHAWMIEVKPATDAGALEPTAAQIQAAKATADAALRDLQGGKSWDEVAKTASTDASSAPQAGDLGWVTRDDRQADEGYLEAVFAADVDVPTAVIEGEDGIFRIGRVSEISPESVDANYTEKLENDGIDLEKYRAVVAGDVIHQKLEDQVVAEATKAGPQRDVREIWIQAAAADLPADSIKVRHILYSPKDDPAAASNGDIPDTDPSWAAAEADARAAYDKIKADPAIFDSTARAESDETSARGVTGTGGKLPYFDSTSSVDEAFLGAIMKPGLGPGSLLEPVKSAFGWHVIQVMYPPTDAERIAELKTKADGGADFAALARDNSEAASAGAGGDLSWVAKGQLDDRLSAAIFATPIGKTSEIVTIADDDATKDGVYLFKVAAEETRTPEGRQLEELKSTAFSSWYSLKKAGVTIERDETITGATPS
jgi:parvulin-like peptidyl-prolyl isomerase